MIAHSLDAHLARYVADGGPLAPDVAATVKLLAETGQMIAATIAEGPIGAASAEPVGTANRDGDQ